MKEYIEEVQKIIGIKFNEPKLLVTALTQSSYANQWQKITIFAELQEGDIVFYPNRNHVYIYINGGKRLDQNYCVVSSSGDRSSMGKLLSADPNKFAVAYRYIGK